MANEIIVQVPQTEQLPAEMSEAWEELTKIGDFIPRIQLYGANSNAVKDELITQGRYGYPVKKNEVVDLGKEVPCIPLSWHFKAMDFGEETPIVTFDPKTDLFKEIQHRSDTEEMGGCVYGIEFLLFVPQEDCPDYVTYFLYSKSARRVAPAIRSYMGKAAVLKIDLVRKGKNAWHVPVVTQCSVPFDKLPDNEELNKKIEQFNTAPSVDVATEKETESQAVER